MSELLRRSGRRWATSRRRICTCSEARVGRADFREALRRNGEKALDLAKLKADAWGCVFFDRLLATALYILGKRVSSTGAQGGRRRVDSTNFHGGELELAVITSIVWTTRRSWATATEIATNKAGVLRPKTRAVTPSTQPPEAEALQSEADRVGAELVVVDCAGTVKNHKERTASRIRACSSRRGGRLASVDGARFRGHVHGDRIIDAAHSDVGAEFLEAAH